MISFNPLTEKLKLWWLTAKVWVFLAVWVGTALICYFQGKESCQEASLKALTKEIEARDARSAKAVKQAAVDARAIAAVKEKGNDRKEEASALPVLPVCVPQPDELRLLRQISEESGGR